MSTTEPTHSDPAPERRLLASFDRGAARRKPVLVERWDEATATDILADARREYAALAPEVATLGKGLLDLSLAGTYEYLAYYKALKRRGVALEEIGGFFADSYHALVGRFPSWLPPIVFRLFQPYLKRRLRREAKESQGRDDADGWRFTYLEQEDGTFGFDIQSCAVCSAFARHDASEVVPYLCALDDEMSKSMRMGLRRTGTRALGSSCCDFRYRPGGEPKTLRSAYSLPVVASQREGSE